MARERSFGGQLKKQGHAIEAYEGPVGESLSRRTRRQPYREQVGIQRGWTVWWDEVVVGLKEEMM